MTHDLRTDGTNVTPHPIAPSNPDAPARIDVTMPRGLYDRLTDHDEARRARTLAQQVAHAMPGADHQDPLRER